ncbi:MAG: sigma 54-interacting transcriptional regulator [Desulfopila sp.]|jgi:CRP-like cAMP-binding protein|nr:sigma 54-interacting transcriptional regulator [Desulfopila sp.]
MKKETVARILGSSILFKKLGPIQLRAAADISTVRYFGDDQMIYQQGDQASDFYVLGIGEVELVLTRKDGSKSVVGRITPGGHFGETSLLTGKPHALGARSVGETAVICFEQRLFEQALLGDDTIYRQMNLALAERLRVSFKDQADTADTLGKKISYDRQIDDFMLITGGDGKRQDAAVKISSAARRTQAVSKQFALNFEPVLLTGEQGTGKKFLAKQIHQQSAYANGPYIEVDLREFSEESAPEKLFGTPQDTFPFAQARQSGIFEQFYQGTVVLLHADLLSFPLQQKIVQALSSGSFRRAGGEEEVPMQARLILVCDAEMGELNTKDSFLPALLVLLEKQHYRVPSLCEHKRDLPRLIDHYLQRYSKEYGKNIVSVSPDTMGLLMNYDWPGNLPELQSVIQRAVMLAQDNTILTGQIILGLPKTEGKWEFNILRIPGVKNFLKSPVFPVVPRFVVGLVILATLAALIFGPSEAGRNIGITMSWAIGWPLLFFSFFFLARTWCSVCTLAVPGKLIQAIVKPDRSTPQFIKKYSGWIMAILCIAVLWVELTWDAYNSPLLTASVILAVSAGSFIFSIFYKRRAWCRYLCPLGAINAIFAMPSVLELRANRHLCLNRCREHVCFRGDEVQGGCPMFRHPFLVDNNRDCIMCAECIKSCNNSSIHLNLRLTPEELWDLETPRRADSFLVVALGAIFFPFALHGQYTVLVEQFTVQYFPALYPLPLSVIKSLFLFGLIALFQVGYLIMVSLVAKYAGVARDSLKPMLGYGFIPLILGCYLAVHFDLFMMDAWRIWPNFLELFGFEAEYTPRRILSEDSTMVLQTITVLGGMLASFYAIYRIMARFKGSRAFSSETLVLPYSFMVFLGGLSLYLIWP